MSRILKYLKPFTFLLVLAVALLFLQANADLALPDYMSRIVNVGIQQSGVESPAPQAMRQVTMERLGVFLTAEEKDAVLAQYKRIDSSSPDYQTYLKQYPALADAPIYVLQTTDSAALAQLEGILSKPLLLVAGLEQALQNPDQMGAFGDMGGFDPSKLPPGMDAFDALELMPAAQRAQLLDSVEARFAALGGEKALRQGAARAVLAEYHAMVFDKKKLQNN